jgi:hypothetical protein
MAGAENPCYRPAMRAPPSTTASTIGKRPSADEAADRPLIRTGGNFETVVDETRMRARLQALEMLVVELVAERLTVPGIDAMKTANDAFAALAGQAEALSADEIPYDEQRRYRELVKATLFEVLQAALVRARG